MNVVPLYQNPNRDGGPLGWLNCNTTVTAMQIAFESANAKHPSGGDVRACTVEDNGKPDTTGGTRPSQVVAAAKRCWGVELDYQVMAFEDAWGLGQRDDVLLGWSISYAPVSGTRFDGSPGFKGLHQIGMSGGKIYDPLADGRRAGIPDGPQVWPKDLLRRAAAGYAGAGKAAVIVARAPLTKPKRYSVAFEPGAFFVYVANPVLGKRYRDEFTTATSAPCSAPFLIPWGTGKKRVVEITAGRLKGKRVEPTATHLSLKESK